MRNDKTAAINTNFLKEWQPFDKLQQKVKLAMLHYFGVYGCNWQPTHDAASKSKFYPSSFAQLDSLLGLAYTSTSSYAALWVCNGGYMWATPTHRFIGFAINELGQVVAIADDAEENSIYIIL